MAAGTLSQLGVIGMAFVGLISTLRSRRKAAKPDPEAEARQASRIEMERRMASYLAQRDER